MRLLPIGILVTAMFVLPTQQALAHGNATTAQKTVGNYELELEYAEQGNPLAGSFVVYNFAILHAQTDEFAKFKSVFVRFAANGDKKTITNSTLAPDQFNPKNARMGVSLPEAGLYTVTVRFYDQDDEEMASATYELTVDPPYNERSLLAGLEEYAWIMALIVGFVLGLVATTLRKPSTLQRHA